MLTTSEERLALLRHQVREWAAEVRPFALEVDRDPSLATGLLHLPTVALASRVQIPPPYNDRPLSIKGEVFHVTGALERAVWCEEVAWGDLGIGLASPGASMCGVLVEALGSEAQKRRFYGDLLERPTWTMFALTEPHTGSDPASLGSTFSRSDTGGIRLDGTKRFVSNAVRARFGAVFARTGPGPYHIRAALVDTSLPGYRAEPIPTIGVRAAQLGSVTLESVELSEEHMLGSGLSSLRRGLWGWSRVLDVLRPTVAAMAVGLARAAYEYVCEHQAEPSREDAARLARMAHEIDAVRHLTLSAAAAVDRNQENGHLASVAKLRAARLAVSVTRAAPAFFGAGGRIEHPLLDKYARDALAFEFMEGSQNVQRLAVAGALTRGTLDPGAPVG
ncbi:acyl-CoA dehydrogenase family protein [Streptomyces olivaceoviridis]|uniref:acyl-CoA dehydrogenase family protein n=1 Tax=Streptomyces olivaceoviridis TaxID=1921 RepID=UPI0036F7BBB0